MSQFAPPPRPQGPPPQQPPQQQQVVLVFISTLAAPIALYTADPTALFEEIKQLMQGAKANAPKLIEKPGMGPLKKVCFMDTNIVGVALQAEMPPQQPQQR